MCCFNVFVIGIQTPGDEHELLHQVLQIASNRETARLKADAVGQTGDGHSVYLFP